ncbi:hypothetical protein C9I57_04805 [Trinickia symbiotica]|uniref:Uncharacterized protein n=1 Tax=Trinickia symbiotica TaxID=863227 RepID=A0A2T3XZJ9_9BURK|nr:hypothetical protein C9I57_04805 [Trinickia symbiotica]
MASAGLAASGGFGRAMVSGDRHSVAAGPVVVIVDASLDESVEWARSAIAHGASVIDGGDDVGALWYRALRGTRVSVVGALRASDFFVIRHLARSEGRTVMHESGSAGVVSFGIDALS